MESEALRCRENHHLGDSGRTSPTTQMGPYGPRAVRLANRLITIFSSKIFVFKFKRHFTPNFNRWKVINGLYKRTKIGAHLYWAVLALTSKSFEDLLYCLRRSSKGLPTEGTVSNRNFKLNNKRAEKRRNRRLKKALIKANQPLKVDPRYFEALLVEPPQPHQVGGAIRRNGILIEKLRIDTNVPIIDEKIICLSDQYNHFEFARKRYLEWHNLPLDKLSDNERHALISKAIGSYRSYKSSLRPNHRPSDDDFYHSWQMPNNLWDIGALEHHEDPDLVLLSIDTIEQFVDQTEARAKAYFDEDHRVTHVHPWGRYNSNVELKFPKTKELVDDLIHNPPSFDEFKSFMTEDFDPKNLDLLLGAVSKRQRKFSF